jgi:serine/threonine protein kinase
MQRSRAPEHETRDDAPPPVLAPGTIVADRYRIDALLGEGGMGAVYRAEHIHMRKLVAIKVLHAELTTSKEVVARFEREAIAAGTIAHSNVAAATDFGRLEGGSFFLVLEYVDGRTLRRELREGPISPKRAVRIARGIVDALVAAHGHGIVHRDLKPENVMLTQRGDERDCVKVLDFGIAKLDVQGGVPLTRAGTIFGTPDYMSPEQALGQTADGRSDLYSLGVMLFEMLTGTRPFQGGTATLLRQQVLTGAPPLPPELVARIDPKLAQIVEKLLDKTPSRRFQSAEELGAALDEVSTLVPSVPAPPMRAAPSFAPLPNTNAPVASDLPTVVAAQPGAPRLGSARRGGAVAKVAIIACLLGMLGTAAATYAIKNKTLRKPPTNETNETNEQARGPESPTRDEGVGDGLSGNVTEESTDRGADEDHPAGDTHPTPSGGAALPAHDATSPATATAGAEDVPAETRPAAAAPTGAASPLRSTTRPAASTAKKPSETSGSLVGPKPAGAKPQRKTAPNGAFAPPSRTWSK